MVGQSVGPHEVLKRTTPAKTLFSQCQGKTLGCSPCRVVVFWWALGGGLLSGVFVFLWPPTAFPFRPRKKQEVQPYPVVCCPFSGCGGEGSGQFDNLGFP